MGNSICSVCTGSKQTEEISLFSSNIADNKPFTSNARAKSGNKAVNLINSKNNIYSFLLLVKLQRFVKTMLNYRNKTTTRNNKEMIKTTNINFIESEEDNIKLAKSKFSDKNYTYLGEYEGKNKQGFGVQRWNDGAVYKGYFYQNKANYLGIFLHSEFDVYKGEFKDNRASGYGMFSHANGVTYEGNWVEDSQRGFGLEKWQDNSNYKGEYLDGKKHGFGFYYWGDGSYYHGEWYENTLHGFVIFF